MRFISDVKTLLSICYIIIQGRLIKEKCSISLYIILTSILDSDGSDAYDDNDDLEPTNIVVGFTYSHKF